MKDNAIHANFGASCKPTPRSEPKIDKSETLILGYDSSNGKDTSALSIARLSGSKMTFIKTALGQEADDLYDQLTTFGCHIQI